MQTVNIAGQDFEIADEVSELLNSRLTKIMELESNLAGHVLHDDKDGKGLKWIKVDPPKKQD